MKTVSEQRLSIGKKIFLITAAFTLPISVLTYFMVVSINDGIDFAAKETWGNQYQRVLVELLYQVQTHELREETRQESGRSVDLALDRLTSVNRKHGEALEFTPEGLGKRGRKDLTPENIRTMWGRVRAGQQPYAEMTGAIRRMITHSGDTSNLILDPDLDSYYLMDVTLLGLPQALDRLGRVAKSGARPALTAEERLRLAVDAALMRESDEDRIKTSTETALGEDPNFYGVSPSLAANLRPELDKYSRASRRFIVLTEALAARPAGATAAGYIEAGLEARSAAYSFWKAAVSELDTLLSLRIAAHQSRRTWCLALAGLSVAIAGGLALMLMFSITSPLRNLVEDLGPGATLLNVCVERIASHSQNEKPDKEEASIICEELAAHADSMRNAVLQLAEHISGSVAESRLAASATRKS